MDIKCYVISETTFKAVALPEELIVELCKSLRTNGSTMVHFADKSIMADGIYVPAKGTKDSLIVVNTNEA